MGAPAWRTRRRRGTYFKPFRYGDNVVGRGLPGWHIGAGKRENESRPRLVMRVDQDRAPVPDDDVTGDGQSDADTAGGIPTGVVEAGETVEDDFARSLRDTGAVVAHGHHRLSLIHI